jgi:hypothetical protein
MPGFMYGTNKNKIMKKKTFNTCTKRGRFFRINCQQPPVCV